MNLFQGKNPASDSLAGPAQQRWALAWPLGALRAPRSQPGPLGARPCTRAGVCKGGTNPDLCSKSWSQGARGTRGQWVALRRHSSAETWQGAWDEAMGE